MPQDNHGNSSGKRGRDGLPLPSSSDLRGRQSVRATFRLSQRAIHAISVVSVHLGIKQKSLFDHLIDDPGALELVADEIRHDDFLNLDRVQKTYVISRRTLSCLEAAARMRGAPRDRADRDLHRLFASRRGECPACGECWGSSEQGPS